MLCFHFRCKDTAYVCHENKKVVFFAVLGTKLWVFGTKCGVLGMKKQQADFRHSAFRDKNRLVLRAEKGGFGALFSYSLTNLRHAISPASILMK